MDTEEGKEGVRAGGMLNKKRFHTENHSADSRSLRALHVIQQSRLGHTTSAVMFKQTKHEFSGCLLIMHHMHPTVLSQCLKKTY